MEDLWDNTDPTLESSTHTKVSSDSTVLFLFSTKYHHHHHSVIPPIMSYSFMISNIFHPTWAYLIYYNQQHAVTEMDTFSSLAKKSGSALSFPTHLIYFPAILLSSNQLL
mmetsp:Transcript_3925/g.5288  ORF Transcript_3925/g.5288 Transcript_3925/m.5288 type:complete len:110 (+) Transcript_3925:164-493(+)